MQVCGVQFFAIKPIYPLSGSQTCGMYLKVMKWGLIPPLQTRTPGSLQVLPESRNCIAHTFVLDTAVTSRSQPYSVLHGAVPPNFGRCIGGCIAFSTKNTMGALSSYCLKKWNISYDQHGNHNNMSKGGSWWGFWTSRHNAVNARCIQSQLYAITPLSPTLIHHSP